MSATVNWRRVVVVGCAGAGKTTFSRQLARRLAVPHVERDALGVLGSDAYRDAVAQMLAGDRWIFDGPPYFVDSAVYSRAQAVVWLDYSREVVVSRAIWRALGRMFAPAQPGTPWRERFRQWIAPGGPWWAWRTYAARQQEFAALSRRAELASASVLHFDRPHQASAWLGALL